MLRTRLFTAAIGLPLVILIFWLGPIWLLQLAFLGFVVFSVYETSELLIPQFLEMVKKSEQSNEVRPYLKDMLRASLVVIIGISFYIAITIPQLALHATIFGIVASMIPGGLFSPTIGQKVVAMAASLFTFIYSVFPWLCIWQLYLLSDKGSKYILFLLAVAWGSDTAAYFVGRAFGKHKLAPSLSPSKTWEGAVGGVVGALVAGEVLHFLMGASLGSQIHIILAAVLGAVFSQLGDLFESLLKRFAGVKDSGHIFPGHGGFLDRVDSILLAAPVVLFFLGYSNLGNP